jgi:predicted metal-binding membrane protein
MHQTHATHLPHPPYLPDIVALTAMWFVMMAAMMAPSVWPWIRAYARFGDESPVPFALGYLAAWLGYAAAAALLQISVRAPAAFAPIVLAIAGSYQLTPLKRACLTHCRNPFSFLLARWRGGPAGGFRLGAAHGAYCVGCCWALMATSLAVGMTNVAWMIALGLIAFVEQVVPHGDLLRIPLGAALIVAAIQPLF